jgi:hypothetical protein
MSNLSTLKVCAFPIAGMAAPAAIATIIVRKCLFMDCLTIEL